MARAAEWPKRAQEELVHSMTEIETRYSHLYHVSEDERLALERSEEDVRSGRFASDADVEEVFNRFLRA